MTMKQANYSFGIIIMAAGKGTRMKSDKAKVLHTLSGRPMINHVVDTASMSGVRDIVVVVGHQAENVKNIVSAEFKVKFALQKEQKGTGHAVQCALPHLSEHTQHVLILSGDVPLIRHSTIKALVDHHVMHQNEVTVLGVYLENPFGYGRLVTNESGGVKKIVEESDADDAEKTIKNVNSGIYCVKKDFLAYALSGVTPDNNQNEMYLTDIIEIASRTYKKIGLKICDDQIEVMGVNTLQDLLNIEALQMES